MKEENKEELTIKLLSIYYGVCVYVLWVVMDFCARVSVKKFGV